ncbi:putative golgi reassembly stacking protein [Botrytis cinerea BcDW1]|uniref:Similar to golgi reassembly stacking protein n=2 Tax=Botryotinia fuckeliana TaxID=40559 RepID=G2XYD0_BOTF4|nr:putative golgi reassembly stacking protein [Botrytis cinerea BcDW1]CCD45467.1 similar to golgi reassembly stacking protein [Botrytis cinerea T4]
MFNALNRFISRLDSDSPTHQNRDNHSAFGFQVLRNKTSELAVEPWFDFIVGINGRMIDDSDANLFAQEGQRTRTIHIPVPSDTPSLGLTLQWTSLSTVSNIWHILDVPANSPADLAGLLPYSDYILGTPEGVLHGESGLGELVEDHIGRPLRLYIYNNEYNVTREVTIHPSRDWGGDGALGCTLGYGALHRLPAPLSEPVAGPGETLFEGESARFSNEEPRENMGSESNASQLFMPAAVAQEPGEFLVPAQLAAPVTTTPARKKEKKHGHNPNNFMDDYFMEGEKKSRELDHAPSTKSGGVPPPPKAGGPPRSGTPKAASPAPSPIPTETKDPYDSGVD